MASRRPEITDPQPEHDVSSDQRASTSSAEVHTDQGDPLQPSASQTTEMTPGNTQLGPTAPSVASPSSTSGEKRTSAQVMSPAPRKKRARMGSDQTGKKNTQADELAKVKRNMKVVLQKLDSKINEQETESNIINFIKGEIIDLEKESIRLVGVFGHTGAGKSTLINALIGEKILPTSSASACTSVMIKVQANMTDNDYTAEIEFIPKEEWEEDLWCLKNDDDDDDIKEKFSALYGEDFDNSADVAVYMDDNYFRDIPEFLESKKKMIKCKMSSVLSKEIAKFTREPEDSARKPGQKRGRRYWPLVKCVTIKVPKASHLLQHVALVDLPGSGDCNKSRDEMWKKVVRDCTAVWIVSGGCCRAASEKEPWEILEETASQIGNGGECQSLSFICTKSDVLGERQRNLSKREQVLQNNKTAKEKVKQKFEKEFKKEIKEQFRGKSDFFQVFTVSATKFNEPGYLKKEDTEIPKLKGFLEDLNDRHSKTRHYVNGAYGILSLMRGANTQGMDSLKADVCRHLETLLQEWIHKVDEAMTECHEAFERKLNEGVAESKRSKESCQKVLNDAKIWQVKKVQSLVENNGIYKPKSKKGTETKVNLNERLSKCMREKINPEFCKTFPNDRLPKGLIKEAINEFPLITERDEHNELALQMTFIKTEEEKLKRKLISVVRETKKDIYSSLEKSIQESMQPGYDKAAEYSRRGGRGVLDNMRKALEEHLTASKPTMFEKAKTDMLELMSRLKNELLTTLQDDMQRSIEQSLKTNDTSVPDVTKQYDKVKTCHETLERTTNKRRSLPPTGHWNCGMNHSCCDQSAELLEFTNPHTGQIVRLKTLTTCVTDNVIYAIQCPCPKLYIGKTTTPLKKRITDHKSSIRKNKGALANHFAEHHGKSDTDLTFWAIENIEGGDLAEAEKRWIKELKTVQFGLNKNKA